MTIVAPHDPSPDHLARVVAEMRERGRPIIRAWWDGEKWIALEGSHRLAAAAQLGLTPDIEALAEDDEIEHDFEDCAERRVADLLEYIAFPSHGPYYHFADLGAGR